MRTKFLQIGAIFLAVGLVAGCAATAPQKVQEEDDSEVVNTRLTSLEGRIADLHKKLESLFQGQIEMKEEIQTLEQKTVVKRKSFRPATKKLSSTKVQQALASAGFYSGPIDGKIGRRTEKAIRAFQSAHGLKSDGIVGKKTVAALVQYLEGGV